MSENLLWGLASGVFSGVVAYFTAQNALTSRLATLEANVQTLTQLVAEQRSDIKELLRGQR